MNNLLAELRAYFATHTRDEILKDWEATAEFDAIGITVDEFLSSTATYHYDYQSKSHKHPCNNIGTCFNPEATSGFFHLLNFNRYAKQYA